MLKRIMIIILMCLASCTLLWANDLEGVHFEGKVRIVTEESNGGSVTWRFNENGNLSLIEIKNSSGLIVGRNKYYYLDTSVMKEIYFYNQAGLISSKELYKSDAKGKINLFEAINYGLDGEATYQINHTYDRNGRIIETTRFNIEEGEEPKINTFIYSYDSNGNPIKESEYDSEGSLLYMNSYKYDEQGNIISLIRESEGSLAFTMYLTYDLKNQLIEIVSFTDNGLLLERHVFQYDDSGNQIAKDTFDAAGTLTFKLSKVYDLNKRIIEESLSVPQRSMNIKKQYMYDTFGNLTEMIQIDFAKSTTKITKYNYLFDSNNNWIKKMSNDYSEVKGKTLIRPGSETVRTITYY